MELRNKSIQNKRTNYERLSVLVQRNSKRINNTNDLLLQELDERNSEDNDVFAEPLAVTPSTSRGGKGNRGHRRGCRGGKGGTDKQKKNLFYF